MKGKGLNFTTFTISALPKFQPGDHVGIYSATEIIKKGILIDLKTSKVFMPPMREYTGLRDYTVLSYEFNKGYMLDGNTFYWPESVLYNCNI